MLKYASRPLRILKKDADSFNSQYLACPYGLYPDDDIEITCYSRNPWIIYIKAIPKDNGANLGYFCLHENKLKGASEARHFLISRAGNREPGIIITASGYDFKGFVEVRPWLCDFPDVKPVDGTHDPMHIKEHGVDMFHLPGGVDKAFRMHNKIRLGCLDIDKLTVREAHEIYEELAGSVPRY